MVQRETDVIGAEPSLENNTTVTTNGINNQYDNMKMVKQGQFVLPRRGGAGAVGGVEGGDAGIAAWVQRQRGAIVAFSSLIKVA